LIKASAKALLVFVLMEANTSAVEAMAFTGSPVRVMVVISSF
jgi:hypothetical protein